jgi:SAM-dependent methyltransferase
MCPICKSLEFNIIGLPLISSKASKIVKDDYQIVQCNKCELYYTYPLINFTPEEWQYLYNEDYFSGRSKYNNKIKEKDSRQRIKIISKYVPHKIHNFLDIGCGEGYSLIEAKKKGWNVHGIDISDHRIYQAKNESINFIKSDLLKANFPSDYFDAIFLDSVLEHLTNPAEYLVEIRRILKKGGVLYIGVPNENSLLNDLKVFIYFLLKKKFSPKIKPFNTPYHVIGFNKNSIDFAASFHDFKIIKLRNFAYRFEFLKTKTFSSEFFVLLLLLPVFLLAIPLNKEIYFEVYIQK